MTYHDASLEWLKSKTDKTKAWWGYVETGKLYFTLMSVNGLDSIGKMC